jgi:uncharacterized membrane protein HdeD (DUF308 family)
MIDALTSRWWVFLVRGCAAILFGILTVIWPAISLYVLTILFGAYAFVDGVMSLALVITGVGGSRWWALLLEGILGLIVAFFIFVQPLMGAAALVFAIALWAILTGIIEIVAGLQLRDLVKNEWLYVLAGILSIAFGVLVIRNPQAGALAVLWLIAFYAILFGVVQAALSLRLYQLHALMHPRQRSHAA